MVPRPTDVAMTPTSIVVLSLSMSADAFAAAVGRGAAHRPGLLGAMRTGLVFGAVEALTPLLGWSLGLVAAGFVTAVDHWIAFVLLGAVGTRMALDALSRRRGDGQGPGRGLAALLATAVGTSIDAAAVGISLAFLQANILVIAAAIGVATFTMASLGMLVGRAAGTRLGRIVEFAGGLALVGLGTGILLEHTGWLA